MQENSDGKAGIRLGVIDYQEAKRIRSLLEDRGVRLELASNPETCSTGGCKPTVEVLAREEDMPIIAAFFQEEKNRHYSGLEADFSLLEEVFDPSKETARCPACGTLFPTSSSECPDCGLSFGGPAD